MSIPLIIAIITIIIAVAFLFETVRYDLMIFQQNSYRNERYVRWLKNNITTKRYIINLAIVLLSLVCIKSVFLILIPAVITVIVTVLRFQEKYKLPLKVTSRVRRLIAINVILLLVIIIPALYVCNIPSYFTLLMWLGALEFVFVLISNILASPIEKSINKGYYNDAKRILESMPDLTIIGITGSFGKTSTKHYLYRILSEEFNVLMTPGSFNTTLGVIRTIREQLKPYHNIFIAEMGAKQLGDIKEICDLVNPSIGIITAVGEQHLETFKNIQNIQKTKFELVDALPVNGFAVLNCDYEYVANRDNSVSKVQNIASYSMNSDIPRDYNIKEINFANGKTLFTIVSKDGEEETIATNLAGKYNLSNLLACYIVARRLGMRTQSIKNAIGDILPVEHRLSMKQTRDGITIIDDAYNSNPKGSEMALEVLAQIPGNKKIIVTPGMIEQGDKQYFNNRLFGEKIAQYSTYAIIVGEYNREAITEGMKAGGFDMNNCYCARTLNDATAKLQEIVKGGDVVLYENDLPDSFK